MLSTLEIFINDHDLKLQLSEALSQIQAAQKKALDNEKLVKKYISENNQLQEKNHKLLLENNKLKSQIETLTKELTENKNILITICNLLTVLDEVTK